MKKLWCTLSTRWGEDIPEPEYIDLREALDDVWSVVDKEHPNTWLRLGVEDGPMYVLDVYGSSRIVFEQWVDADYGERLAPASVLVGVALDDALKLWDAMHRGDLESVKREAWQPAEPGQY